MSAATKHRDVLTDDDLREVDRTLLEYLSMGRVTPAYARSRLEQTADKEYSRGYIQQRLSRLEEHGHVINQGSGLYELVDDPREDVDQSDQDDRDRDRLQERVDGLRRELEAARTGDTTVDVDDLKDAQRILEEVLDERPD